MRIALVSYEYPPDTAYGGIATYTEQWANSLCRAGHDVEVFCASETRDDIEKIKGITVHRIKTSSRRNFKYAVLTPFEISHEKKPFDLIESPELHSDAKLLKQKYREIRLVVKLHTPSFLINELNNINCLRRRLGNVRFFLGAIRRFRVPRIKKDKEKELESEEKEFVKLADVVTCPSRSLIKIVSRRWRFVNGKIYYLPNPYVPSGALLHLKSENDSNQTITFIGRLERRKGIFIFLKVIPKIVKVYPDVKFRFVGRDTYDPILKKSVKTILELELAPFAHNLDFKEHVPLEKIPEILRNTTLCLFPSIWENFPTVCLEAMSAGRAIIGGNKGGMADMFERPRTGFLVNPKNTRKITSAIFTLLSDSALRDEMGTNARKVVLEEFNDVNVIAAFEEIIKGKA